MTKMVGGVISGYWATGSVNSAIAPSSTIMSDSTEAKIGRRMKKWENFTAGVLGCGFTAGAAAGSFGLWTPGFGPRPSLPAAASSGR